MTPYASIRSLTFIHAADLHLGAPFRGLKALNESWQRRVLRAIPEAWNRVVDAAIQRHVDFMIIAGDIFDMAHPSYRDYRLFFEGLERLNAAQIPVYLCTGNHDPYSQWHQDVGVFPPNVTMLAADKPDFALFERDGRPCAIIGGRGYPNKVWSHSENIAEGITRAAAIRALGPEATQAPYAVGVLHTGLTLDKVKAPSDPTELLRAGFDYWALGHIHRRWSNDDQAPRVAFSGCIQGRDLREGGPRGVSLVQLQIGAAPQVAFIPTASVALAKPQVDVSTCATIPNLISTVMRALFALNGDMCCEEMITRITLTGTTPLHRVLGRPGVLEEVRTALNESYTEFFCDCLVDHTRLPLDEATLKEEGTFAGMLLQASDSVGQDTVRLVTYLQDEFLNHAVELVNPHSDKVIARLAQQAQAQVLDVVLEEEEEGVRRD